MPRRRNHMKDDIWYVFVLHPFNSISVISRNGKGIMRVSYSAKQTEYLHRWYLNSGPHNLSRSMTKPTKWLCAQRRLRSAWAFAKSSQSLLSAWISYPLRAQWWLQSDWADAQADQSLRWAHSHFVGFVMRRLWITNCSATWIRSFYTEELSQMLLREFTVYPVNNVSTHTNQQFY